MFSLTDASSTRPNPLLVYKVVSWMFIQYKLRCPTVWTESKEIDQSLKLLGLRCFKRCLKLLNMC